jgi:hypothetical protein
MFLDFTWRPHATHSLARTAARQSRLAKDLIRAGLGEHVIDFGPGPKLSDRFCQHKAVRERIAKESSQLAMMSRLCAVGGTWVGFTITHDSLCNEDPRAFMDEYTCANAVLLADELVMTREVRLVWAVPIPIWLEPSNCRPRWIVQLSGVAFVERENFDEARDLLFGNWDCGPNPFGLKPVEAYPLQDPATEVRRNYDHKVYGFATQRRCHVDENLQLKQSVGRLPSKAMLGALHALADGDCVGFDFEFGWN